MKLITEANKIPYNFTGIVEYNDGTKVYYTNGKHHRIDGPAYVGANDDRFWYKNGLPHREDGPAVEWADGEKEYWINGRLLTEKQFDKHKNPCDNKIVEIDRKKYKLTLVG